MIEVGEGADRSGPFVRHRGPVTCAAGVPESSVIVTSGYDGAVGWFDAATGEVALLGYHDHLVNRIVVSPTGTLAATPSSDYTIGVWDLATRSRRLVLLGHSDDVEDFAFVNEHLGVSVSRDRRIIVWDLELGRIERIILGHQKDVLAVVCDGERIFTSGDDMTLRVWDLHTGRALKMWGPFENETDSCAVDPIHGRAVLGCDDGVIRVFDINTSESVFEIPAHGSGIKKVAISPVTGDILSAAYDQRIRVFAAADGRSKAELQSRPAVWERSFNWLPDGSTIVAGGFDGTVYIWDSATGRFLEELGDKESGNPCLNEVSANEHGEFVTVSDDGFVRLGRITTNQAKWLSKTTPPSGRILANAVTLDDDRDVVVTGAHDHKLHIFKRIGDALTNEIEVSLGEGPINSVRVSSHPGSAGDAFVACYSGAIVRVDPKGRIVRKFRVHDGAVKALRLHSHRPIGVSCSADNSVASWDLEGNRLDQFIGHMAIVDDVDIDPSGQFFVSVSRDFTLKVYDLESGRLVSSLSIGQRSPKGVIFWDPRTVIVTNYWGALIRADLETGKIMVRQIAENGISSIARAGQFALAVSYDGVAYLVRPEDLVVEQSLRGMTQRLAESSLICARPPHVVLEPVAVA